MDYPEKNLLEEPLIFDTHAHYDDEKFDAVRDELLSLSAEYGVKGIITCGCDIASSNTAKQLAEKYANVFFMAGIHPENVENADGTDEEMNKIAELALHKKCVGIGEIGLDYYWTKETAEKQRHIFEKQLILANELCLPVTVHDRDAHSDTLELLKKHRPKGVVHSFSGSEEMAEEIYKTGMYIGIGGVITFKNARRLPDVVKNMPLDRFVLETDAPYLAPVPYRSKTNHSALIYFTAEKIAEIRNISVDEVLKTALKNTAALFDKADIL